MTVPTAEVLISPELAYTAMQQMQKDFERGFKKISDNAEKQIEKGIADGAKDGLKKGFNYAKNESSLINGLGSLLSKGLRKAGGKTGVAKALGAGIVGGAIFGFNEILTKADLGATTIEEFLGRNEATSAITFASSTGMTLAEFTALGESLRLHGGITEQQDINDIVKELSLRVNEQVYDSGAKGYDSQGYAIDSQGERIENGGRLINFGQYQGRDQINQILASSASLNNEQRLQLFDEAGLGEVAPQLARYIDQISQGGTITGLDLVKVIADDQKTEGQLLAEQLEKQAQLETTFRQETLELQKQIRSDLLANLDSTRIDTLFSEREREANEQVQAVKDFNENMKIATVTREVMARSLKESADSLKIIKDTVIEIKDTITLKDLFTPVALSVTQKLIDKSDYDYEGARSGGDLGSGLGEQTQ